MRKQLPRGKARPRAERAPRRPTVAALQRRLARLEAELAAERERQARRSAAVRRAADRRLASMVQEIAALRHHEARAEALTRLLAERDAQLADRASRLAELEGALARLGPRVDNRALSVAGKEDMPSEGA
jgi:DNA repair exonuclease SbcCD ATPase subunit